MLRIRKGTGLFFIMNCLSSFLPLGVQVLNFLVDFIIVLVRISCLTIFLYLDGGANMDRVIWC